MKPIKGPKLFLFFGIGAAVLAFVAAALLVNIFERKQESLKPYRSIVEITPETDDPAIWGQNFPDQYATYLRTVDSERTKYGGSEAIPRMPSSKDPRTHLARSKIEEDTRLKTIWAGYAFSQDFREERGHAYMFSDQLYTDRQKVVKQPGTCINCHASTVTAMRRLGGGDLVKGFHKLNLMPYSDAAKELKHPVACIDCHAPSSMRLTITRPAFMEGIKGYMASKGIKDFDVNRDASPQQMRTFVCAQCHVEYYFKGTEKTLTYPWSKGVKADEILAYYDESKFKDWLHSETGAPALKAQHPEYEMYEQGVHAKSGVSCTDCHMPYQRVGAAKITNHHVQSPLLNLRQACLTCHKFSETEMRARVETIQDRHTFLRNLAMDAVVDLIDDLKLAGARGPNPPWERARLEALGQKLPEWKDPFEQNAAIQKARDYQRKAQFLLDFAEAENSTGFHAPQEGARILGLSIDYARKGQKELRKK